MLSLMERIKKKEDTSGKLETEPSTEVDVITAESLQSSEVISNTVDNDSTQLPNVSKIPDNDTERKDHFEPVGITNVSSLEKRKNEFSSLKKASKRSRTSILSRGERKDLNWPERNSSTSCLSSWLVAAEQMLVSSAVIEDIPKAKRTHDQVTVCSEDSTLVCQPVKKTKNIETSTEALCLSTQPLVETMETSPVLTPSNKRTRHNSVLDNSFTNEKMSETDDSPIFRPKKRTKSISAISPQMSKESLKLLPELILPSQKPYLNIAPADCPTASPVTLHISAASPDQHLTSTSQLQVIDNNSNLHDLFTPMDAQNTVCYLV
jgi:virulence-associated protein VagC